jgi:mRNA-degrading endonuclease YafQ of YafQ-DinJ toxin-antitoxin module
MGTIHTVWEVYEHRRVVKQLASLPLEILKRYEKWKDIAMVSGLTGLRLIRGFHDEALQGEWQEHRSSRLGLQYRVIYKVFTKDGMFQVISITPHDYRRM